MEKKQRYEIIVSARAKQMMGEYIRFMVQASPGATRKVKGALVKAIASLAEMPARFPLASYLYLPQNKYRSMVVGKCYIILYQIVEQTVFVDYIIDCRQAYGWLL